MNSTGNSTPGTSLIVAALDGLVTSAQPAVVFTALTRVLVPLLCHECTVTIVEEQMPGYRIVHPDTPFTGGESSLGTAQGQCRTPEPSALHIAIVGQLDSPPSYRGTLSCIWHGGHRPDTAEVALAQLAVDRAVNAVHRERTAAALALAETKVENLQIALATSRQIGVAIGVLMNRYLIRSDDAFALLRTASQHSHQKLRDIAAQVVETGELPPLTQDRTGPTTKRLHAVRRAQP